MEELAGNSKGRFVNGIRRFQVIKLFDITHHLLNVVYMCSDTMVQGPLLHLQKLTSFGSTCPSINQPTDHIWNTINHVVSQSATLKPFQTLLPMSGGLCEGACCPVLLTCGGVGDSDHGFEAPEWKSQCTGWHSSIGCYQACTSTSRYLKNHPIRLIKEVLLHRWKRQQFKIWSKSLGYLPYHINWFSSRISEPSTSSIFAPPKKKTPFFWRCFTLHRGNKSSGHHRSLSYEPRELLPPPSPTPPTDLSKNSLEKKIQVRNPKPQTMEIQTNPFFQ